MVPKRRVLHGWDIAASSNVYSTAIEFARDESFSYLDLEYDLLPRRPTRFNDDIREVRLARASAWGTLSLCSLSLRLSTDLEAGSKLREAPVSPMCV